MQPFKKNARFAAILAILLLAAGHLLAGEKDFSIVVLPDPQHYADKHPDIGLSQTKWICRHVDKFQIKFVVTVGDNVNAGYKEKQYKNSRRFMDQLDGVVPYGVACGNHDLLDGKRGGYSCRKFVENYGPERFKKYPWYGGASPSGFSSYQTFSGGGMKFLALELAVCAPKEEIDWAKKVIGEHPDLPVILTTHEMLRPNGEIRETKHIAVADRQSPAQIWEQLIEPSPRIFLVLCGHFHGESHITKTTQASQPVHVVLQDYQDEPNGGNGWLRIFTFRPDENKIEVKTYSPTLKEYWKRPKSEFSLEVDFKQLGGKKRTVGA